MLELEDRNDSEGISLGLWRWYSFFSVEWTVQVSGALPMPFALGTGRLLVTEHPLLAPFGPGAKSLVDLFLH